ncbi:redoxin domain-containing protein [Spirosoma sp. SC4-14]|uniref:redoxin domain-containing protein n=1 Tax=Spirosoma sp. SC4-14 TaxID=3128900 RepID=UPI0030D54728
MTLQLKNEFVQRHATAKNVCLPLIDEKPLEAGERAPFFTLVGREGDWKTALNNYPQPGYGQSLTLPDLTIGKPVVVSFYCASWGRYAEPWLAALIRLGKVLDQAGVELVVFSIDSPRKLTRQGKSLPFILAHDTDQQVAKQFGVYDEDNPVWDRVSGISGDAFIPAVYVINPDRRIVYQFLDENFDTSIDIEAVVSHVWSLSAADPEFAGQLVGTQKAYAYGFFALWVLGLLVAASSHMLPF